MAHSANMAYNAPNALDLTINKKGSKKRSSGRPMLRRTRAPTPSDCSTERILRAGLRVTKAADESEAIQEEEEEIFAVAVTVAAVAAVAVAVARMLGKCPPRAKATTNSLRFI